MSSGKDRKPGGLAVQWPFIVGLALIALATVTNIALDGMTQNELDSLPSFMAAIYGPTGKLGVTLILVAAGLIAICVGLVIQSYIGASRRVGGWHKTPDDPAGSNGQVALDTNKYLGWAGRQSVREWGSEE